MSNEERINCMEDQLIDMRLAVSALLETVTVHQHNFETSQRNFEVSQRNMENMQREIRDLRTDMVEVTSEIRDIQTDVRGLQTENRRILDILQNRNTEDDSEA
jgi:septal ring factor EnvC (AmiA/AmiB activator)